MTDQPQTYRIKALEWQESGNGSWFAETLGGRCWVREQDGGWLWSCFAPNHPCALSGRGESFRGAKCAADDYHRRVVSRWLEPVEPADIAHAVRE